LQAPVKPEACLLRAVQVCAGTPGAAALSLASAPHRRALGRVQLRFPGSTRAIDRNRCSSLPQSNPVAQAQWVAAPGRKAIRAGPERHASRRRWSRHRHGSLKRHLRACAKAPAIQTTAVTPSSWFAKTSPARVRKRPGADAHRACQPSYPTATSANRITDQRCRVFITRSTSRLPSRSLMVSRLSCSALPLARAISHFTLPAFQCRFSGTRV